MLNQITPPRPYNQPPEDALDLLLGCHQRIRHFTVTAKNLAHAQGATHDEIRMAAAGVHRYYSVSLPLHEADEEDSVRPRLDALDDERVHHALAAMHDQHQAIDESIERLLPLLQTYLSFKEIGARLSISANTVKTEAMTIYGKLGASTRSEAVERAVAAGLLEDPFAETR